MDFLSVNRFRDHVERGSLLSTLKWGRQDTSHKGTLHTRPERPNNRAHGKRSAALASSAPSLTVSASKRSRVMVVLLELSICNI